MALELSLGDFLDKFRPSSKQATPPVQEPLWNNSVVLVERIKASPFYEERGDFGQDKFYQGRPIIFRDTPINGGVYPGSGEREAIVVDDKKDLAMDKLYQILMERLQLFVDKGEYINSHALNEVFKLVQEVMPYDMDKTDKIVRQFGRDNKVYLSKFLGGGVCRHQALAVGYLLERLKAEGHIRGKVSIDRNVIPDKGGHAWARYTNSKGDAYILDVAQGYIGALDGIKTSDGRWFYERPEDKFTPPNFMEKVRKLFTAR